MTRGLPVFLVALAASLAVGTPASAQSVLQISVTAGGSTTNVAPGGSVTLTSPGVGQAVLATVTVRYAGTSSATITGVSFAGTSALSLGGSAGLPVTLNPNNTTSFLIQYLPSSGSSITGQVSIAFTENNTQSSVFTFTVNGNSPDLAFTYFVLPNGALTSLAPGAQLTFPSTNLGSSTTAVVSILNRGSAAGSLQSVTVSGADYQVTGATVPASVPAGQQASFNVVYTPHSAVTTSGLLTVGLNSGSAVFFLTGSGTNPSLSVFYTLSDGNVHPLTDGATIPVPSVDVNGTTTVTINIANQGTGSGTVTGIAISGTGFALNGVPPLPLAIGSGQALHFGIVFAPTAPGSYTGAFRITLDSGTISGTLSASTNPSNLAVSYALADGNAHPIANGTVITYPAIDVNTTSTATITILNQGTGAGTVSGISIGGAGFQITGSPLFPSTVAAGQSLHFGIVFAPTQVGNFTGNFTINLGTTSISGTMSASTNTPTLAVSYALSDGIIHTLTDGAAITLPSVDINANTTATFTILNQGTGTGSLTGITLSGAGFQLSGAPQLPATIASNQSVHFGIVFTPTKAGTYTATFRIDVTGRSFSGTLSATTASSSFTLSYIDPNTNNIIPLVNNSTLPFPSTLAGSSTSISLLASNNGAGTGSINSITLGSANSPFQLLSLPPLPLSVPPAQQLKFGVRFSPQQQQNSADTMRVDFNGQIVTVNLQAQGTQAQYSYGVGSGTVTTVLAAGGTVSVPDTPVGQTSSVGISVNNFGTGDGQISTITVTGQGLTLTDLPTLPLTLHPNGSQHFTLNFAPTQPGAVSGRLTIGSDTFTVSATGIGSKLIYTYTSGSSAVTVAESGAVIFPPLAVGGTESLTFSVQNTGTSAATISSISLATSSTLFSLSQLPALPANLNPGASLTFLVGFAPNNTGSLTATLAVNSSNFTLSGNGTQPAALPAYQFQGPSGNQQPAQQPALGLTLAAPYPSALQGTLTLTFVSSVFTDDPSIQFASGGRTVNFTIPANTTQALFSGNAATMALQTGTTAGNIVITPAFTMQGGFNLTPASPNILTLTVQSSAPQLLNATVSAETLNSFTLILNGYSTTRALRQLVIQVTPKQGKNFSATNLTIDVSTASSTWFQSTASQGFGGSFLVAIPFSLSDGNSTDDLVHMLQSLSITATNATGTSNAISVPIP